MSNMERVDIPIDAALSKMLTKVCETQGKCPIEVTEELLWTWVQEQLVGLEDDAVKEAREMFGMGMI